MMALVCRPWDYAPAHPVQLIQKNHEMKSEESKKRMLAQVYGVHVPIKLDMEQMILTQFQRFPGLPSTMVFLSSIIACFIGLLHCVGIGQFGLETVMNPNPLNDRAEARLKSEASFGDTLKRHL